MCKCGVLGAGHIPVFLVILLSITFGLTYLLAVNRDDVDPFFPYISDTGTKKPESCVFGLLINIAAFLSFVIVHLRYRLVKELNRGADRQLRLFNRISLLFGGLASFGMLLVANFQETAVLTVHYIGAFTCFGVGLLYSILETVITVRMYPLYNGKRIIYIRAIISLVGIVAFLTSLCAGFIASSEFHKVYPDEHVPMMWYDNTKPGYPAHVVSAVGEWVLAITFALFFLSYSRDFEKMRVGVHVEPTVTHLDESPIPTPYPANNSFMFNNST